jgi:FtsP/CotA-like multicopper oxidase with cupredoxin domain
MTHAPPSSEHPSRRAAIAAVGAMTPLALLGRVGAQPVNPAPPATDQGPRRMPAAPKPDYVFNIEQKTIAPLGTPTDAILVNGADPGTEIRYTEGDMFRVLVNNTMQIPCTVHWHGLLVPNYMDGVPEITQYPIGPRQSVFIEYPIVQSGSYWYHSHYGLQEQQGLRGPYIIEEARPAYDYDKDITVFMTDWLDQSPDGIIPQIRNEQPQTDAVKTPVPGGEPFPGTKPFNIDVNYPGYLMNGKSVDDPWTMQVKQGDRLRLRLINGSTATFFRVQLEDHEMEIITADGQPVVPTKAGNVVIAIAERYDVLVTIKKSGSFTLNAVALGTKRQVAGVLHTKGASKKPSSGMPVWAGRSGGSADYASLKSPYPTVLPDGPVKTFNIELGGKMKQYLWSMAGEYYPEMFVPEGDAGPLRINYGDRVRIRFTNSTMMYHPMHLHGHFYRLLSTPGAWGETHCPLKDTVAVGPGEKIDIEFFADNPGHWFFHCHNLYHLAAGMARKFEYVV